MLIRHNIQIEYKLLQYQSTKKQLNEELMTMEFLTEEEEEIDLEINKIIIQTFFGLGRESFKNNRSFGEHRGCLDGES